MIIKTDHCDLIIDKSLIQLLFNLKFNPPEVVLPHDFGMKITFLLSQMTISNDFEIKILTADIIIQNSKINGLFSIDSVDSSFVKFKTKKLVKLKADIIDKSIDLKFNLKKITIYVIALIDLISMLPLDLPKTHTPRLNLNIKINPIEIDLCFIEDHLSIVLNSPLKLNISTLKGILPYASLKMNKFLINLNNSEILTIQSFYFILDKNIDIDIPLVTVMFSMTQVYKLIKMLSIILQNSFINVFVQKKNFN